MFRRFLSIIYSFYHTLDLPPILSSYDQCLEGQPVFIYPRGMNLRRRDVVSETTSVLHGSPPLNDESPGFNGFAQSQHDPCQQLHLLNHGFLFNIYFICSSCYPTLQLVEQLVTAAVTKSFTTHVIPSSTFYIKYHCTTNPSGFICERDSNELGLNNKDGDHSDIQRKVGAPFFAGPSIPKSILWP